MRHRMLRPLLAALIAMTVQAGLSGTPALAGIPGSTNPKIYLPEFGGFCVVGAAFGEKVDVDPETGQVVSGKLYLNNNQRALEIFNKDQPGTIAKAKGNWPAVKDKAL